MKRWLTRREMIAAELFSYSYPNYAAHLGIGNARFDKLMPQEVDLLEKAERENWESSRIAKEIDLPQEQVDGWLKKFREAKEIMDAPSLIKSFRRAIGQSIENAISEGLADRASVERLITQICYRAADLAYRLDASDHQLSDFSEELREETKYDDEYWDQFLRQWPRRTDSTD